MAGDSVLGARAVPESPGAPVRLLGALASLRFTLVGIGLLAVASVAIYQSPQAASAWLAAPLLLLAVNLMAAVATNAVFRRQVPLLVFHLSLITLALLAALGRLTYLKGAAEVTEGTPFAGPSQREAGPLHPDGLDSLSFVNEGFDVRYKAGGGTAPIRDRIVSRVRWLDEEGRERVGEIGDHRPLLLAGYRIYPTFNKGFAPVLLWRPAAAEPVLGAIHLPSYPANALRQAREWRPPGSQLAVWVLLDFDETLIPADRDSRFRLPDEHRLVVRHQDRRWELRPGERAELPGGALEYQGLRTWMGYSITYDWTIPWLLATCLVAVLSLAWHFWAKFAARPWNP
jgi:cytochrome c biogenesis protein